MAQGHADRTRADPERGADPEPDEALLERIATGDDDALAALCARHQQRLRAYLTLLTSDKGLVEEVLQDTLLAVWKGANGFAGQASVRAWLLGIARRRAYAVLRRRVWHLVPVDEIGPEEVPLAPDPADVSLATAERAELEAAIHRLGPAHQEIIALVFVHELTYQELADMLGVPIGTVKSRLHAARQALRTLLDADTRATPS